MSEPAKLRRAKARKEALLSALAELNDALCTAQNEFVRAALQESMDNLGRALMEVDAQLHPEIKPFVVAHRKIAPAAQRAAWDRLWAILLAPDDPADAPKAGGITFSG